MKHPRLLRTLFFTEMWERFSFYGMRALLVLYLVNAMAYSDTDALHIYGIYTGLVYLTPLIGGYIADKYTNSINAILIGGVLMMVGHALLAFEPLFFIGLGFLIAGNGFFKPNISSMLGNLYLSKPEKLRDEGFSYFYIGINIGAFLAPLVIGFIGEFYSWHLGFLMAALGMLIGLTIFCLKINQIEILKNQINYTKIKTFLFLNITLIFFFIYSPIWLVILLCLLVILFFVKQTSFLLSRKDLKKIYYIFTLGLFSIIFWVGFEQAGGSLTLFTDSKVDKSKTDTPEKMSFGLMFMSVGFLILTLIQNMENIHFAWIILIYFFHTVGELCLSPTSLSMVTKVAPKKNQSLMIGLWFLTFAIASYFAGLLPSLVQSLNLNLFKLISILTFLGAITLVILRPYLRKLL
ncbi:MAG: MFS transporter [Nitrosomonadales bacterium]|nr:MFS transporter [Nitrosomonadales bacterium]